MPLHYETDRQERGEVYRDGSLPGGPLKTSDIARSSDAPLSWSPDEKLPLVQVSRLALAHIDAQCRNDPGLLHHDPTMGGILIGRRRARDSRSFILIDSAIPFAQADIGAQLTQVRASNLEVLGFYRAGNELTAHSEDRRALSDHLPGAPSVLLRIRPTAISHSAVKLYLSEPAGPLHESDAIAFRCFVPVAKTARRGRAGARVTTWAVLSGLSGCVAGLGWAAYLQAHTRPPEQVSLGLAAQTRSGRIAVEWNTGSTPIGDAVRGELVIDDGPAKRSVPLNPDELRRGRIAYTPGTPDIRISLAALDRSGHGARENLVVIGPARQRN